MTKLYGLGNCDTCRRARRWLAARDVEHDFVDFGKTTLERTGVDRWIATAGIETVLNKRSKAWRDLDADAQQAVENDPAGWMIAQPRLIKRPLLETGDRIVAGFDSAAFADSLGVPADDD